MTFNKDGVVIAKATAMYNTAWIALAKQATAGIEYEITTQVEANSRYTGHSNHNTPGTITFTYIPYAD